MLLATNYGRPERKRPSLHGLKFTPTPKFLGMLAAYFVCHIGPIFQISLIYAFIGCPQSVLLANIARFYNSILDVQRSRAFFLSSMFLNRFKKPMSSGMSFGFYWVIKSKTNTNVEYHYVFVRVTAIFTNFYPSNHIHVVHNFI